MATLPYISSIGPYCLGQHGQKLAAATWPGGHRIIYVPLRLPEAVTALRVFWGNAGAVSGNVNVGLYSSAGTKAWETGSTGQSGQNQMQWVNIADQAVDAGLHYLAMQVDNTTAQFDRLAPTLWLIQVAGVLQEAAGSFALPATATFAKLASAYVPVFGLDLRGV